MQERIKWLLVGVGVMYATQWVILLAIRYLMPHSGPEVFHNIIATIGYTLVAFLVGGFVIGLMAERILIIEPILAASATLLLDVLFTEVGWLKETFLFSVDLLKGDYFTSLAIGAVATAAAIAGALAGERITVPQEDWLSQTFVAVGLAGLLLGPFLVLGPYLPLAFAIIIGLALFGGILMAAYRFGRAHRRLDEISIRPESHLPPEELRTH